VNIFRRILAVLLLAIWLTATQHCALEAAGILKVQTGETIACCTPITGCSQDGCELVERGSISASLNSIKLPAPELQPLLVFVSLQLYFPIEVIKPSPEFAEGFERSLEWVPTWHLERRAAPSPRAPALILA